jgi:hypothetical protein
MTERALGKGNVVCGDYRITEARSIYEPSPATAEWRVYWQDSMDPMSIHRKRREALQAVARYQDADKRRLARVARTP